MKIPGITLFVVAALVGFCGWEGQQSLRRAEFADQKSDHGITIRTEGVFNQQVVLENNDGDFSDELLVEIATDSRMAPKFRAAGFTSARAGHMVRIIR